MDAGPPRHSDRAVKAEPSVARVLGLSMIADYFAVDPHTAALLATAFSLPYAIMQPVLGGMADAFGKTRLMTWSLVVLVISAAIGAAAPSFPGLFAARMISGIVAG